MKFTIGLDIGIASVGWSVLTDRRIPGLGVRTFDSGESADGVGLNTIRRQCRLLRNRFQQRAARLAQVAKTLQQHRVITDIALFTPQHPCTRPLWQLRVEALDRPMPAEDWARIVYHLCKHRGFYWTGCEDDSEEQGKIKSALEDNRQRMNSHRTAAEMILSAFPHRQRNTTNSYEKSLSRIKIGEELELLFTRQRQLGNSFASESLQEAILGNGDRKSGLFWLQKPALSGDALLEMVGRCTFEKSEYRAPKACFLSERHVLLTRIINQKIATNGTIRSLTTEERAVLHDLAYQTGDVSYKQARKALTQAGTPAHFVFQGLKNTAKPEDLRFFHLPAWKTLRQAFQKDGLESTWKTLSEDALQGNSDLLDRIACVLTIYKEEDDIKEKLGELNLPDGEKSIQALSHVRFSEFVKLSVKALKQIVPLMESGMRYDEAVAAIPAYSHRGQVHQKTKTLPPLYVQNKDNSMSPNPEVDEKIAGGIPNNPVVLRAINQARKVVNAIIRKYGQPERIHIEMARDLSRPKKERDRISREQLKYQKQNDALKKEFAELFECQAKGEELEKFRLYKEQLGQCPYSLLPIDLYRLNEPGYVEVDHILPISRSLDDSKNNKVLVYVRENQQKGNRTPYEYLGGESDTPRWQAFVTAVAGNKQWREGKRNRLLRKNFDRKASEEFIRRNLNDTRYICKFFKEYIETFLQFSGDDEHCVVLSGQLVSFLRSRWRLQKNRDENDRHHALDATVIAACGRDMVKRLSDYARRGELKAVQNGFVDPETGEILNLDRFERLQQDFPIPWANFREELLARLKIDDPVKLRQKLSLLGCPDETAKPLFVSLASQRRSASAGAAHKETIYRDKKDGSVTERIDLVNLTLKHMDRLVNPHRDARFYAALRQRLEEHDGDGKKAFSPDKPIYKTDKNGKPTGQPIRAVTLQIDKFSGVPVRGGLARNSKLSYINIFEKEELFYVVPIYLHQLGSKKLPNRAVVSQKHEKDWIPIDQSFTFKFSVFYNDLIEVRTKNKTIMGYYKSFDRNSGAICLMVHDRNSQIGEKGFCSAGVRTALSIRKFDVDILGGYYPRKNKSKPINSKTLPADLKIEVPHKTDADALFFLKKTEIQVQLSLF